MLGKEIGKKWTIIGCIIELLVAYVMAFIIYTICLAGQKLGALKLLLVLGVVILILFSFIYIIKKIKGKKACHYCKNCDKNCK